MATNLTVLLANRPGTLADLGEALGNEGINMEGVAGFPCEREGVIQVLVADQDVAAARTALAGANLAVRDERPVLIVDVEDRPGAMGALCRRIADAGVNVDLLYVASGTRLVVGADDLEKARSVL